MLVSVISIRGRSNTSAICSTHLGKTGEYQFCVLAVFKDAQGQTLPLKLWDTIAKLIGITAVTFIELEEEQKKDSIGSIDSKARCNIVVKFTSDGLKLTNLELAGEDNAKGDAVSPPAKKDEEAKKRQQKRPEDMQMPVR